MGGFGCSKHDSDYTTEMSISREELRKLPLAERLDLVGDLWDSIAKDSEQLTLTGAQMAELDRRFEEYQQNPKQGVAWEEVRDRSRTKR